MAQRALWKGVIQFGSVRVPVKFYSASQEIRMDFKLLHEADNSPIRQEMVCSVEGVPVPPEHQVKGLEVAEGEYVVVKSEELDSLEPESSRDIQVQQFVKCDDLDVRYFERPYYLAPDEDASMDITLYSLLVKTLTDARRAGVCQWTMRKRAYWGAVVASDDLLVMTTLRTKEEVIPTEAFDIPPAQFSDRELQLAEYLIDELTGEFKPAEYHPVYYQRVRELDRAESGRRRSQGARTRIHPAYTGEGTGGYAGGEYREY